LKKPAGSVRFRFYKQKTEPNRNRQKTGKKTEPNRKNWAKTEKTEPNRNKPSQNQKKPRKPSQNRKNRVKPVWTGFSPKKAEPNRTETGRFDSVSVFFSKKIISVWLLFLIKTEPKIITPSAGYLNRNLSLLCVLRISFL